MLITDSFPQADGAGISQTLYNLLKGYDAHIVVWAGESEVIPESALRLPAHTALYNDRRYRSFGRRPFLWMNSWRHRQRLHWMALQSLCYTCLPAPGHTVVLVSTTVPEKLLLAWRLQQEYGYTVLPYFMDDWLAGNNLRWKDGNIHQVARDLLANAPAWLMISENLKQVLMQRYQLDEKPCLIVHNPAPAPLRHPEHSEGSPQAEPGLQEKIPPIVGLTDESLVTVDNDVNEPHRQPSTLPAGRQESTVNSQLIIYAGSIWPMHADALVAVAKAMHLLHQQGHTQYSLQLYVPAAHWQQYQTQLQGPGVEYAGWVPYAQLQEVLQPAWLTLCTASFLPAHRAFSYSSVQTKLTDYMAAGKPIWFVGPFDAASGRFVQQHECGYVCNDHGEDSITQQLHEILADKEGYRQKANAALQKAAGEFSQPAVQQRLAAFLQQHAPSQPQSQP
jgi:glycosyltransferase involved in cell wall biosynthesis